MEQEKRLSSKDFRIGNLIAYKSEIVEISSLHSDDTFRIKRGESTEGCFKISNAEPVQITREWLFRFGFEYTEINDSYQIDSDLGFSIWGRIRHGFNVSVNSDQIGVEAKHVHELQNMYFALTGEELKYKTN